MIAIPVRKTAISRISRWFWLMRSAKALKKERDILDFRLKIVDLKYPG
jgi:hypothetical protein